MSLYRGILCVYAIFIITEGHVSPFIRNFTRESNNVKIMRTVFWFSSLVIVMLMVCACGGNSGKSVKSLPTVRIDTARQAGNGIVMEFPGRVVSAQEANLSFMVSGTIARLYVREGDYVKAGQLVAEIDSADYCVQLSATEAEYAQVKAEAERVMALYAEGAATANNYDKARYGLRQIEAKLQHHRNQVEYCRLYAPYSGHVKTLFFESRETIGAGMPVVGLASDGRPEILVNLPGSAYLKRKTFSTYSAVFNILPGQVEPLELVSIMSEANTNQLYPMRLRLSQNNPDVSPGMSVWVTIKGVSQQTDYVRIPSTAIVEDSGKSYVFVYAPASHVVSKRTVEVKRLHTDGSAVVSGNLKPGDMVVSSGAHFVHDADTVMPLARTSSTNVGGLL